MTLAVSGRSVEHALAAAKRSTLNRPMSTTKATAPTTPNLMHLAHEDVDRPAEAACQVGERVRHAASLVPEAGCQGTGAAAGTDILPG